jgi:hypothetical protein
MPLVPDMSLDVVAPPGLGPVGSFNRPRVALVMAQGPLLGRQLIVHGVLRPGRGLGGARQLRLILIDHVALLIQCRDRVPVGWQTVSRLALSRGTGAQSSYSLTRDNHLSPLVNPPSRPPPCLIPIHCHRILIHPSPHLCRW